ncbi:MAG: hypothetical protein IPN34_17220 [Planctomycetes bacterium]|nr:hypothetical protein [Planctomycetota bacterium]
MSRTLAEELGPLALQIVLQAEDPAWLTREAHAEIYAFIAAAEGFAPPLLSRDVVGLLVLKLITDQLRSARRFDQDAFTIAAYRAIAIANQARPARMKQAGFAVAASDIAALMSPDMVARAAQRVVQRFVEWSQIFNPADSRTHDEREQVLRGAARMLGCIPMSPAGLEDEMRAAKRAQHQLAGYQRKRAKRGGTIEDDPDAYGVHSALYAVPTSHLGKIMFFKANGELAFSSRAIRDLLATPEFGLTATPEERKLLEAHALLEREQRMLASDPAEVVAREEEARRTLEELERLRDVLTPIELAIVENPGLNNAELGRRIGVSGQAVGQARARLRQRVTHETEGRERKTG